MSTQFAVFGGGCFWCTEAFFQRLKGVNSVLPGYAGGTSPNPSYDQVCTGRTGHAEVIKIEFDPAVISYEDLLEVFFATHDPTTKDRQGNDRGTQYRSIILAADEGQKRAAEEAIAKFAPDFPAPIVTEVKPLGVFYPAEDYHQNYYNENGAQPYCSFVISPKLAKFKKKFAEKLDKAADAE
jgi:peptide-methionine (S)-S-oxide reductase